eukprot:2251820-Pyramimonas_sp.AAC.1
MAASQVYEVPPKCGGDCRALYRVLSATGWIGGGQVHARESARRGRFPSGRTPSGPYLLRGG